MCDTRPASGWIYVVPATKSFTAMSDIDPLIRKLGLYRVPLDVLNEVVALELARLRLLQKVESAYAIIRDYVDDTPDCCTCHEAYTRRGLTDPECFYCDMGVDRQTAVAWLAAFDQPERPTGELHASAN
jgi:hypothetical protein